MGLILDGIVQTEALGGRRDPERACYHLIGTNAMARMRPGVPSSGREGCFAIERSSTGDSGISWRGIGAGGGKSSRRRKNTGEQRPALEKSHWQHRSRHGREISGVVRLKVS
jgi:hypothetical protein